SRPAVSGGSLLSRAPLDSDATHGYAERHTRGVKFLLRCPRNSTARGAPMNGPFNSVTDVRKYIADLDSENCPVARRTRELREEREAERERVRKERVAERQRDEQQGAAARNSEAWYAWLDKRISEHFLQYFHKDAEGNVGPLTSAIGEALGHTRVEMRKELEAAIDKLRGEFRIGQGRVPIAKSWDPDEVCHQGDVVSYGGETFQALQDTGKTPAADHPHWRLLASRGRDAISPRICGAFNAHEKYRRFDIAELDGSSFIALYDDPGIPGIDDGWQLLAGRGGKGPPGQT